MGETGGARGGPNPARRPIPDLSKYAKNFKKFVIKAEGNQKLNDISIVRKENEIRKILAGSFSRRLEDSQVKIDRFGDHILVTVVNEGQAKILNKITSFAGHRVKVEAPYFLNTVKGTIYFPGFCNTTEEELVEYFAGHSVVEAQHFKRKTEQGLLVNNNLVTLTFCDSKLPSQVWVCGRPVEIKPFVRNVKQCRRCLKIGHTKTRCRQPEDYVICANCQGNHKTDDCKTERAKFKCIICPADSDNNHSTKDKQCPTMIYEKEICSIMAHRYLSYSEAKATIPKPKPSYANITKSGLGKAKSTNTIAIQTTCSIQDHVCECYLPDPEPSPTDHVIIPTMYKNKKTTVQTQADIHNNPESPSLTQISASFNVPSPLGPIWSPLSPVRRAPQTQFKQNNQTSIEEIEEGERIIDEYTERITDQTENIMESSEEFVNDNNKRVAPHNHREGVDSHRPKNHV